MLHPELSAIHVEGPDRWRGTRGKGVWRRGSFRLDLREIRRVEGTMNPDIPHRKGCLIAHEPVQADLPKKEVSLVPLQVLLQQPRRIPIESRIPIRVTD